MLMKMLVAFFGVAFSASAAAAQCGAIPNTLTNGQNADATQVMANFNHLRDCVNNAPAPGIDDTTRRNLLLNTALLAKAYGSYVRNLNVFADGYKTSDGINAGASANYAVDPANGRVAPSAAGGGDEIPTMTGSTTAGVTMSTSSAIVGAAWNAGDKNNTTFVQGASGSFPWTLTTDLGTAKVIGSYALTHRSDYAHNINAWTLLGSATGSYSGEETTLDTRSGISNPSSSPDIRTYAINSPGSFRYYRIRATAGMSSYPTVYELNLFSVGATNNMTIVTTTQTADGTISKNRVLLEYNPVDAIALNTDLTVEVTCNGGTNWTSASLVLVGSAQAGNKVAETADTTCGTSGTSFAARIKTLNNKNVQIFKTTVSVQ